MEKNNGEIPVSSVEQNGEIGQKQPADTSVDKLQKINAELVASIDDTNKQIDNLTTAETLSLLQKIGSNGVEEIMKTGDLDMIKQLIETQQSDAKVYPTGRERDAINRLFEGGLGFGKNNPISLSTTDKSAYRLTGESQITDIIESGFVRPPLGKLKGGHRGEVHWSRGGDTVFYFNKKPILQVDVDRVPNGKKGAISIDELQDIWIFNEKTQKYESKINEYRKMAPLKNKN